MCRWLMGNAGLLLALGSTTTPTCVTTMSVDRSDHNENKNDSPSYGAKSRPMSSSAASLPPATKVC
eukprot:4340899-Prymnesium_polylepis.1